MEREAQFFDFAAAVGLTKHLGGVPATDQLTELCHIQAGAYVLDVGCGAGATPASSLRISRNISDMGCTSEGSDNLH